MSTPAIIDRSRRRRPAALTLVLALVMVFFIAILVFVWVATKRASPVMLDQRGNPVNRQSSAGEHGTR
jgi:hypothetical protein